MSSVEWSITGPGYNNCNCDWGCPCQFNALPTHGNCRAILALRIDEGHYGDVRLDGLCGVTLYGWPEAVHLGNGSMQSIIDERADAQQREALAVILQGDARADEPLFLNIFRSTMTTVHDPLYKPIEFTCEIEARTVQVRVPGIVESDGEPIRNPVTGDTHRAQVTLPHGMEYNTAEYASGTTKTTGGDVPLDFAGSHSHLTMYRLSHAGVVH